MFLAVSYLSAIAWTHIDVARATKEAARFGGSVRLSTVATVLVADGTACVRVHAQGSKFRRVVAQVSEAPCARRHCSGRSSSMRPSFKRGQASLYVQFSFSERSVVTSRAVRSCRAPPMKAPNQAMQLTASKPAVYAWSVCRRERMLRGMHSRARGS